MAGERTPDTSSRSSGGSSDNDISLREHMQRQMEQQERLLLRLHDDQGTALQRIIADLSTKLDERFVGQARAIDTLASATADKFASVNEFRGQLTDQARTFITRDESLARHDRTSELLADLTRRFEQDMKTARDRTDVELKTLRDRHELDMGVINSRLDLSQGSTKGLERAWGYIIGAVGLAGGLIGLVIATR